ncbi:MAG: hypothetical protein ABIJ56_07395 [Pseudomonadota bacterium]
MKKMMLTHAAFGLMALCTAAAGCYEGTQNTTGDGTTDTTGDDAGAIDTPADSVDDPVTDAAGDPAVDPVEETEVIGPDWTSCLVPSDCVIVANSCCGVCGMPTLADMDAANKNFLEEHYDAVCDDPDPICPGCAEMPNPELVATCEEGRCLAVDLGAEDLTLCASSDDCVIRTPECCECGADMTPMSLVAIRIDAQAALAGLVCDPDSGCPECAPVYPDNVDAICDGDGHCAAVIHF